MKIRRLSEIDLARICPLNAQEKVRALRKLRFGRPPHTYNPLRASLGDLFNLQPELFGVGGNYTSWEQISKDIARRSKSESEAEFNLAVAKAIYEFGIRKQVRSYSKPVASLPVGYGQSVTYWWNFYTIIDEQPCFLFVDPRISHPLTSDARKFVLSLMHERIRVPDPDFANARLLVAQFGKGDWGQSERVIKLHDASSGLFSFDELNEMIDETYKLWIEVLSERTEETRKQAVGATPMGF